MDYLVLSLTSFKCFSFQRQTFFYKDTSASATLLLLYRTVLFSFIVMLHTYCTALRYVMYCAMKHRLCTYCTVLTLSSTFTFPIFAPTALLHKIWFFLCLFKHNFFLHFWPLFLQRSVKMIVLVIVIIIVSYCHDKYFFDNF